MDVTIHDLSLDYGSVAAVEHLSLDIADGESLVLLGQSGCGKTSTMRCVAGLENPTGGTIRIGGTTVFDAATGVDVAPNRRKVGLVFQSYAVWPHMTVLENVSFPLRMQRVGKKQVRSGALEALELVGLAHLADKGASLLSGGQMQRVALARSLAMRPDVLLLDEPLSNLDARLREDLRVELRRLQLELGLTSIYVTHDQGEALALADRIAIMQHGRISQLATPEETYRHPVSASVAEFLGVANILPVVAAGDRRWRSTEHALELVAGGSTPIGGATSACIRPEHVTLGTRRRDEAVNSFPGTVEVSVYQGSYARCAVRLDAGPVLQVQTRQDGIDAPRAQDRVHVEIDPEDVQVLPQEVGRSGPAEETPAPVEALDLARPTASAVPAGQGSSR